MDFKFNKNTKHGASGREEIKKIFGLYETVYGIKFKVNIVTEIPEGLFLQGKKVTHLIKKEQTDIYKVTLSNGEVIHPSIKHPFMVGHKNYSKKVHLGDLSEGDTIYNDISIVLIKYYDYDFVYDFTVDTKAHTYMKAGVKHHNSLDDIPLNHQFDKVNFDTPSKEDFLRYMADRFTNTDVNTGDDEKAETITNDDGTTETTAVKNPITPEVYNAFVDAFSDDDLGGKDALTDIRISPRRWEEIMKYINANIPVDNMEEARQLLTFLRDNFKNYINGEVSELYKKYEKVVKDLIKETSGFDASDATPLAPSEWRGTLDSQIKTKMKLGDDRKYVPIISGAPGIGKCLHKDYEITLDLEESLYNEYIEFLSGK